MTASVFVTNDPAADALYVYLMSDETAVDHTEEFGDHRIVDFDDHGRVVGVEFLGASQGIELDGIPEAEQLAST